MWTGIQQFSALDEQVFFLFFNLGFTPSLDPMINPLTSGSLETLDLLCED